MEGTITKPTGAQVDFIGGGQKREAYGSVAAKVLAVNGNMAALRTNDLLPYDAWKQIDAAILMAYQRRLVGVADLVSRGLTYNIPNGLGVTVLQYQDISDLEDAEMDMDAVVRGRRDRPATTSNYLPLPIIHADFSFSIREIEAWKRYGMPLDTSMAEKKASKIAEKVEAILFTGASSYAFGGGTIYGYLDEPNNEDVTLNAHWNDSAATGATILEDVRSLKQALINNRCFGPYMLYVPTNFETKLDDDYMTGYPKSIRQRILEIEGIQGIKVADFLTSDYVVLVQMTSDVIRIVNGLPITTVQWESNGGFEVNFKVLTIQVPQTRHDQDGRCGIAVGTL